jgi:hypothetical protein
MSQNLEARIRGLQPPLPLVDPVDAPDPAAPADPDAEWRLDEHTREVGRRGIAEARARLRPSGVAAHTGAGRPPAADRPRNAPGRAA